MAAYKGGNLRSQYGEAAPAPQNEEKEALFQRILQGDEEAREPYIKGNLRLVLRWHPNCFPKTVMKMWMTCFRSDASA